MCNICELGTVAPALRLLQVLVTVALDLRADPQNKPGLQMLAVIQADGDKSLSDIRGWVEL